MKETAITPGSPFNLLIAIRKMIEDFISKIPKSIYNQHLITIK